MIFQELREGGEINQLIFFVNYLHTFEFPLYFTHYNQECDVINILLAMGTHQDDPLRGALFAIADF
jgi:hypothetical protein